MDPVVRVPIDDELDWLPTETVKGPIHRVRELLPPGYDAYLRIFHPLWPADRDEPTDGGTTRSWRSFALEAGVVYHGELTLSALEPVLTKGGEPLFWTSEGDIPEPTRSTLFELLARESSASSAYFYFGLARIVRGLDPLLVQAPIRAFDAVPGYAEGPAWPEWVWATDRSWVLCTDYDLTSSYIACSRSLADGLAAELELETHFVALETRVDDGADELNGHGWAADRLSLP